MQLTAGRHAQEYNQRRKRKSAYWEDRYHATAIETGKHLLRCLVYIDLPNRQVAMYLALAEKALEEKSFLIV